MAFENEALNFNKVVEYGIEELVYRSVPNYRHVGIPKSYQAEWTFDKDRNIFFFKVNQGREERSHLSTWLLSIDGEEVEVVLANSQKSHSTNDEYVRVWGLESIVPKELNKFGNSELVSLVKEILVVYKKGVYLKYNKKFTVKFDF